MKTRSTPDIIEDIKAVVHSKGFIYALCMIIMDDFHFNVEKMHEIDNQSRLNKNEILLLMGFFIQDEVRIDVPDSPLDLSTIRKRVYELMDELHHSTMHPFYTKIQSIVNSDIAHKSTMRSFFADEGMFIEPIFYSGDGIYDFQYLEFLDRKYKYDETWLNSTDFYFDKVKAIVAQLKSLHQAKIEKIKFIGFKENRADFVKKLARDKSLPKEGRRKRAEEMVEMMEFYQYEVLFETEAHQAKGLSAEEVTKNGWNSFYRNLIELFTIQKRDFSPDLEISSFLDKFMTPVHVKDRNLQFKSIGDFNLFASRPIIQLDSERYFIPISFSVFEAAYESPFYWMMEDKSYNSRLAENRGRASEEIVYGLLLNVFGKKRVYKSVRVVSKKGHDDTDIDVLCVLGSKALCVQVKSKKLTQLSRKGNLTQLKKDFQGAIQDAYEQGLLSRARVIERKAVFYDENDEPILLPEEIDDAYILVVTTENYPSLTHQSLTLLEKEEADPHALILTVFDLELILFYLTNPYDFLYYVRQRITLMDYYLAGEEIHYLGYHLVRKLWRNPKVDRVSISNDFGQLIDQNYYPFKLGINLSTKVDKIKNRWRNGFFDVLCDQISELNFPNTTDIIFWLLDWSNDARDNLMNQIRLTKDKTRSDGNVHSLSVVSGPERSSFGLTYIAWHDNVVQDLDSRLQRHCKARKYKSKAEVWIGIGSVRGTDRLVDRVFFINEKWHHDQFMEEEINVLFAGENEGSSVRFGNKVGRNDLCTCGSGVKYKKCCGQNN